jgi:outer membrane protein assembly factor BamA
MRPALTIPVVTALSLLPATLLPQAAAGGAPSRWEITGIPALNYDADDKFGYGAIFQAYNYGGDATRPYRFTIQPTVFLTTGGRRDITVFFDAPAIGGSGWRVDAYAGSEVQRNSPYYGIGNATVRDTVLETQVDKKYYRFGRDRLQFTTNVQRKFGRLPLRALVGAGASRVSIDAVARDATRSFLRDQLGTSAAPEGWSNYVRAGLVWDSRDRETHTRRGTWADVLVQRVDETLGSDWSYTRATLTVRHYVPLTPRLTLAGRVLMQNVSEGAPFYDLAIVQTSFKPQEGLGGSTTLRGVPKNRYLGRGLATSTAEVRWRASEFAVRGAASSLTLSAFVDAGRVWADGLKLSEVASDLHAGYGGGVRVGRGSNFVVALDVGHSSQSTASIYLGLGFLF